MKENEVMNWINESEKLRALQEKDEEDFEKWANIVIEK